MVWIFPHRVAKPRVGKKNFPMSHEWRSHEWQIGKFTIPHFSSVVVCHNYTVSVNLTLIKLNLNISTVGVISITPTVDISTVGVISITPTVDTSLLLVLCHNTYSRRCSMGFTFKWCHYISFHLQYCYGNNTNSRNVSTVGLWIYSMS